MSDHLQILRINIDLVIVCEN